MCERHVVTAVLWALLALMPARAAAQQPASAAELEAEVARLTPLYLDAERTAIAAEETRDSRREAGVEQDTVQVGPLRIVTSRAQVERARRLFTEEWARWDAITRGRTERLDRITYVFHVGPERDFYVSGQSRPVFFPGPGPMT